MQSPQLKNKRIVYKILILIHPSLHEYNWYPIKSKMRQNFTKNKPSFKLQIRRVSIFCRGWKEVWVVRENRFNFATLIF